MQNSEEKTKITFGPDGPNWLGRMNERPKVLTGRTVWGLLMLAGKFAKNLIVFVMGVLVCDTLISIAMSLAGQWPLPTGDELNGRIAISLAWLGYWALWLLFKLNQRKRLRAVV
jgi:hypothetical protein